MQLYDLRPQVSVIAALINPDLATTHAVARRRVGGTYAANGATYRGGAIKDGAYRYCTGLCHERGRVLLSHLDHVPQNKIRRSAEGDVSSITEFMRAATSWRLDGTMIQQPVAWSARPLRWR